jgi:hypothetical protein
MSEYITPTGLKAECWTDSLISQHLGQPDARAPNPHYKTAGAPMRLYLRSRVAAVAERPEVKEQLAEVAAKRASRRESAKKAVQTKVNRARNTMQSRLSGRLGEIAKQYSAKQLIADACASYNRGDGIPDWAYEKRDWAYASPNSDPAFLQRICCNYARHQLLHYEQWLGGYTGTGEAHDLAHRLVAKAIERILEKM